jgi:hypothetical protein
LYVYASREQIRADKIAACAVSKIVKYAISMILTHLGVYVKARVAELGDFLGQQFNSLS